MHPLLFQIVYVSHIICEKCKSPISVTWIDNTINIIDIKYSCHYCNYNNYLKNINVRECYECQCGTLFTASCPFCHEIHDDCTLYYKIDCSFCKSKNLVNKDGLKCIKCYKELPSI